MFDAGVPEVWGKWGMNIEAVAEQQPLPPSKPILFNGEMVRAILAGQKMQTRRLVKPLPPSPEAVRALAGDGYHWLTDRHWPEGFRVAGPVWAVRNLGGPTELRSPYGMPRELLWVRETWAAVWPGEEPVPLRECRVEYRADDPDAKYPGGWPDGMGHDPCCARWKPSIHMPRWASRITLRITDVRVERLQDISEDDARAEGVYSAMPTDGRACDNFTNDWCRWTRRVDPEARTATPRGAFAALWHRINGKQQGCSWKDNPWVWAITFEQVKQP